MRLSPPRAVVVATALAVAVNGSAGSAGAQQTAEPAAPSLRLEEVTVTPAEPAADTLCKLSVKVKNDGAQTASLLAFEVAINGQQLPVYATELFALALPAGATTEVPLFNFWSTETGREAAADGKLRVEVRLTEARWVKIEMEGEVEVWTPVAAVAGLPAANSVTLKMKQ